MNTFSLVALPAEHLRSLANHRSVATGGGSATERGLALAAVLVAIAAAVVLAFVA